MQKFRKGLVAVMVLSTVATFMVLLAAAPAQAAAGNNVALIGPSCGTGAVAFFPNCPGGAPMTLSSRDGLTARLTAVAWGGDDAMAAYSALFYVRQSPIVGTEPWNLVGIDSTPAVPDGGPLPTQSCDDDTETIENFPPAWPNYPASVCGTPADARFKAFEVDLNTAAMPGGGTGPVDIFVAICGEGTTSWDANAGPGGLLSATSGFDRADNFRSGGDLLIPLNDCAADGLNPNFVGAPFSTAGLEATFGVDMVDGVAINNNLPVVNLPSFPNPAYHGDALPVGGFTVTAFTSPIAGEVALNLCQGVQPNVFAGGEWTQGTHGVDSLTYGGAGCAVDEVFMQGGPTTWTLNFSASPTPGAITLPGALQNTSVRLEAMTDLVGDGNIVPALATVAANYIVPATPFNTANQIYAVWDYDAAQGNRQCFNGSTSATSQIDPVRGTDYDGDGREQLSVAPAPDGAGKIDIDDGDNPVLKVCVKGPGGLAFPQIGTQVAYEVVSGPGDIDADTPTYLDGQAVSCFDFNFFGIPATQPCSGGYTYWPFATGNGGPIYGPFAGGYARPGSIADAPLNDPLGRGISRVCGLRPCQKSDITDLALEAGTASDFAAVNSTQAGTTTYRACVDLNGDRRCGSPGEISATATMTWTPGGRNHNHAWVAGTETADGHAGQATISQPAGDTVDVVGILQDGGHNALAGKRVIARLGTNSPGHIISPPVTTTGSNGKAVFTIGSSVLDAARTTEFLVCGDGDADGICDQAPAKVEINWGGVVTTTSISGFSVTPAIGVFGTQFTATGSLLDGDGDPVSSATVKLQRRTLGSINWETVAQDTVDGAGAFVILDEPTYSADYRAVFEGNVSYNSATSATDRAFVRVGIALNASDPTVLVGDSVRLSGRVLPAHPGAVVTLQALDNGRGWRNVASARLSASSTYAFTVRHGVARSVLYRVTFPTQTLLNAWNVSRNLRLTWA